MRKEKTIVAGILVYEGMELLDAAGPAEVFASTTGFELVSIGVTMAPAKARASFTLLPDYYLDSCPHLDVLIIPGGNITPLTANEELLRWLKAMSVKTNLMLSVCTGAFVLAAAGLLENKSFTTHHSKHAQLQRLVPSGKVVASRRYVDSGNIITTAGVSAGIDGALYVVKRLKGSTDAQLTAQQLEYPFEGQATAAGRDPLRRNSENPDWISNK